MNYFPWPNSFLAGFYLHALTSNTLPTVVGPRPLQIRLRNRRGALHQGHASPGEWVKPYLPPNNYENVISFLNGYTIQLLSTNRATLARGGDYGFGHIDELALLKEEHANKILMPMIRGNIHRFAHHLHQTFRDYTSVPRLPADQWVFKTADLTKSNHTDYNSTKPTTCPIYIASSGLLISNKFL